MKTECNDLDEKATVRNFISWSFFFFLSGILFTSYTNYFICLYENKGNRILFKVCLNLSLSSFSSAIGWVGNELFGSFLFLAEALLIRMRLVPLWE